MSQNRFTIAWDSWTVKDLKEELRRRQISSSGLTLKAQIIKVLCEDDAGKDKYGESHDPEEYYANQKAFDMQDKGEESDYDLGSDVEAELTKSFEQADEDTSDYGFDSGDGAELEAMAEIVESPIKSSQVATLPSAAVVPPRRSSGGIKPPSPPPQAYPTTSPIAQNTLRACFGLSSFRLKQEAAISRLLAGGSAVVVFPTGGGKSLCYQVPAFAFAESDREASIRGQGEGGITLVVSPLIALMKDQVDALRKKGLSAACLDSTKSRDEYLETMSSMRDGTLKLLYCAPERLNNEGFIAAIANCRSGVRLVAIDEAHCISEWGHAFRPDYLKVARFVKEIKAERVVCLTATATPKVAQDVCNAFNIDTSGLFRTATYRSNLRLHVESAATKQDAYPRLVAFLREHPGSTIIYITTQSQTEELAGFLIKKGFLARSFHAGMPTSEKSALQDAFMASDKMIMVATIAFGMGVDKSNIRSVIHFDIPRSLEGYSQEIGRAGRDGKESQCLLYLCGEDLHLKESFARGDLPSKESVRKLLQDIFDTDSARLRVGQNLERKQYQQSQEFDMRPTTISSIYAQLELRFGLVRAVTPRYEGYSYEIKHAGHIASDKSPQAAAIRASSKTARKWTTIDIDSASQTHGMTRMDFVSKLNDWAGRGVIDLRTSGVINVYRVLKQLPMITSEVEKLVKELYQELQARETQELARIQDVINLVTGTRCFAKSLSKHFGDELPNGKSECGHCTWCETRKAVQLIKPPPVAWDHARFKAVLDAVPARDDARFLARVAFGIMSPRVAQMKLNHGNKIWGSMADHDFEKLYNAFVGCCSTAAQTGETVRSDADAATRGRGVKRPASAASSSSVKKSTVTAKYSSNTAASSKSPYASTPKPRGGGNSRGGFGSRRQYNGSN